MNGKKRLIGFIPVGGSGGAMQPLTSVMPKCLMYAGKYTLLEHAIFSIMKVNPEAIYFISNNNFMWPQVHKELVKIATIFQHKKTRFEFIVLQEVISNTGSILKLIPELINNTHSVISFFPDVYLANSNDIIELYSSHLNNLNIESNYLGTIISSEYRQIHEGMIEEKDGLITRFIEKPCYSNGSIYNTAISILEPRIVNYIYENNDGLYSDVIPSALKQNEKIGIYKINRDKSWFHLRTMADLHDAHCCLLEQEINTSDDEEIYITPDNFKKKII